MLDPPPEWRPAEVQEKCVLEQGYEQYGAAVIHASAASGLGPEYPADPSPYAHWETYIGVHCSP